MALMVPEKLPSKSSRGEKKVFSLLQTLDDDCIVYYEPLVKKRNPDFIVILPRYGVLVIEVKGWYPKWITAADSNYVTINPPEGESRQTHPDRQAQNYMYGLMDEFKNFPSARKYLFHSSGKYKGRLKLPLGRLTVFNNIKRENFESMEGDTSRVFSDRTIARDELEKMGFFSGWQLYVKLGEFLDPFSLDRELSKREVEVLRGIIHPEVIIGRSDVFDLKVMDLKQERHARSIGEGHRIIFGVAGSGKTIILIARAKLLAENTNNKILILCYNKQLAFFLSNSLSAFPNVDVANFHKWAHQNGCAFDRNNEIYGERLKEILENKITRQYDAVLIDEAQDFVFNWFQCAILALKDRENGDLLIVADGNQSIYKTRGFRWKHVGISARGARSISKAFDLHKNYRNTREILELAAKFTISSKLVKKNGAGLGDEKVDKDAALRNGSAPVIKKLNSREDECNYVASLIENWLLGGVDTEGETIEIIPENIGVLYPRCPPNSNEEYLMNAFCERLSVNHRCVRLNNKSSGSINDKGIKVSTIHASKGLQYKIVILMWADMLRTNDPEERRLTYVALTRAEDHLYIVQSRDSAFTN